MDRGRRKWREREKRVSERINEGKEIKLDKVYEHVGQYRMG
jgi:hypothetical protein